MNRRSAAALKRVDAGNLRPFDPGGYDAVRGAAKPQVGEIIQVDPSLASDRHSRQGVVTLSMYKIVNPATGQLEREFPTATDEELADAVRRTDQAYQLWKTTPFTERTKVLRSVAELYRVRADELALLITREMGKPTSQALDEIEFVRPSTPTMPNTGRTSFKTARSTLGPQARVGA